MREIDGHRRLRFPRAADGSRRELRQLTHPGAIRFGLAWPTDERTVEAPYQPVVDNVYASRLPFAAPPKPPATETLDSGRAGPGCF